jgi:hypothetical protein
MRCVHGSIRPQIKYIAVYRTGAVSAITHIAPVKSIEPWKDTGTWVELFGADEGNPADPDGEAWSSGNIPEPQVYEPEGARIGEDARRPVVNVDHPGEAREPSVASDS